MTTRLEVVEPKTIDELRALLDVLNAAGASEYATPTGFRLALRGGRPAPLPVPTPKRPAESTDPLADVHRGLPPLRR